MKYDHLVKFNGEYYPAGTEVPVGNVSEVELTDNVPDGALKENADGSVNAYDEAENKVGTVDAKTVEQLQEDAGEAFQKQESDAAEPDKPKRGRKSKEA